MTTAVLDLHALAEQARSENTSTLLSQVSAFCRDSIEEIPTTRDATKRRDQRERVRRDHARPILTDPDKRRRKWEIETGYNPLTGSFYPVPLEPWNHPDPLGVQRTYTKIARGGDGAVHLVDLTLAEQDHVWWLQREQLVIFDQRTRIRMLGDPDTENAEEYPGAPVPDHKAKIGRQLRQRAAELVRLAWLNITLHRETARIAPTRRAAMEDPRGLALSTRDLCREANKIKSKRPDLAAYRYLSVRTCQRVVRQLLDDGELNEIIPPRRIRQNHAWKTLPRVYETPAGYEPYVMPPNPRKESHEAHRGHREGRQPHHPAAR